MHADLFDTGSDSQRTDSVEPEEGEVQANAQAPASGSERSGSLESQAVEDHEVTHTPASGSKRATATPVNPAASKRLRF